MSDNLNDRTSNNDFPFLCKNYGEFLGAVSACEKNSDGGSYKENALELLGYSDDHLCNTKVQRSNLNLFKRAFVRKNYDAVKAYLDAESEKLKYEK